MSFPAMGFGQICSIKNSLLFDWWTSNTVRKRLVTPENLSTNLAKPVIMTLYSISIWVRLLMTPSIQAACIAPSGTTKTCQQGRSLLVNVSLIPSCTLTNVCIVFNNGVLSSSYGGLPRTMKMDCIVLESPISLCTQGEVFHSWPCTL